MVFLTLGFVDGEPYLDQLAVRPIAMPTRCREGTPLLRRRVFLVRSPVLFGSPRTLISPWNRRYYERHGFVWSQKASAAPNSAPFSKSSGQPSPIRPSVSRWCAARSDAPETSQGSSGRTPSRVGRTSTSWRNFPIKARSTPWCIVAERGPASPCRRGLPGVRYRLGYDAGEDVAHMTTNASPGPGLTDEFEPPPEVHFFRADEIVKIEDEHSGTLLFESSEAT